MSAKAAHKFMANIDYIFLRLCQKVCENKVSSGDQGGDQLSVSVTKFEMEFEFFQLSNKNLNIALNQWSQPRGPHVAARGSNAAREHQEK